MKLKFAMIVVALAASMGVSAGVELRSQFVDNTRNTFIVEMVNTETDEVISVKRFQYNDAGIAECVDGINMVIQEGQEESLEVPCASCASDGGVAVPADDSVDSEPVSSSAVDTSMDLNAWDKIVLRLEKVKDRLAVTADNLKAYYEGVVSSNTVVPEATVEPLPEPAVEAAPAVVDDVVDISTAK